MRKQPFSRHIDAKPHTPVYTMHRYFARRPHNVFAGLIEHYTAPGNIILDPFCGGGVTVVESLGLGRRVVGVDVNPLATYVTEMEVRPLELEAFLEAYRGLEATAGREILRLYRTACPVCRSAAVAEWTVFGNDRPLRISYRCPRGHAGEVLPRRADRMLVARCNRLTERMLRSGDFWVPPHKIPPGDKTSPMIRKGYRFFWQLFTPRNLYALAVLHHAIGGVKDRSNREFLYFAFSGALKWASRQSHLRGAVVEAWAMHAYWTYPEQLEINIWRVFEKRVRAIVRGKRYAMKKNIAAAFVSGYAGFGRGGNCLILGRSSSSLPLPDRSIDAVITDPPYGDNVNYAELADYWTVWNPRLKKIVQKKQEAVINRTQNKDLRRYGELLAGVMRECHRVLKPDGALVATFNSKDLEVVTSFLHAAASAGFRLMRNGLLYQEPIKAYTTTVHAKEVGAFTGDFIFTFEKAKRAPRAGRVGDWKAVIDRTVARRARHARTEIEFRRGAYAELIPLLAGWAGTLNGEVAAVARYAERQVRARQFKALHYSQARSIAR